MIQKDPAKAMKWLKMAAEHGSAEAKERLAKLEEQQKTLALLEWDKINNNLIVITRIKDRNVNEIYVPDFVEGKKVFKIGTFAFLKFSNLKEIHLPKSLQSIGACAFYGCRSLKEIRLPDSLKFIDSNAFENCNNLKKIYLSRQNYKKFKHRFPETAEFIIHD